MERSEFLKWLRDIESKWQRKWRETRAFEANADSSKPKFFITVPYPYSNAPLHIGHGRTYTIGDIIARYKRLRGFNVLFPMAFHITGTPIAAISERISRGDRDEIERYKSYISMYVKNNEEIDEFLEKMKNPLELAVFFADRIHIDFDSLGYSIDWRRRFHTGESIYNAFVTWQFTRLMDRDLLKRGDHIVTYCLLHHQPEGEDDIVDADTNPVEILEYTAIKFKLINSDIYLVASTLRPETLFGATNIWIKPDSKYVVIEWRGEKLVVSSKAVVKIKHQYPGEEVRVVSELDSNELIGRYALSPLGSELIILPADFIDLDNATGIVYSEPSDAPYDYVALMNLKSNLNTLTKYGLDKEVVEKINPIKIINVPGVDGHHAKIIVEQMNINDQNDPRLVEATKQVYREQYYRGVLIVNDPEFRELRVSEAKEKIRNKLVGENKAFTIYELNRKAYCRAGGEIIVAKIINQWFIDYSTPWWKDIVKKYSSEKLVIIPEKYRNELIAAINWVEKRPCARKRGIGTKLPQDPEWIIESLSDSTIYMAFYIIAHIIRRENIRAEQLKPCVFDYVYLGRGDPVEVSRETGIPLDILEEMRKEFVYWYGVDQRHTGIAHISNHLVFYIFHHVALFPENYWPRIITLNELVIREGAKMSKSKGNVIPLREIAEKYSADLFRLYIATAANLDTVLDWREKEVASTIDSLKKFVSIARKAVETERKTIDLNKFINKWFLSRFNKLIIEATNDLERMEIRSYVQKVFFETLSIIEHYRERTSEQDVSIMVREVLDKWIRLLNPVIPHLTEEINEWLGSCELLSISKWPEPDYELINEEVELLENMVINLIDDLKNVLNIVKPVKNTVKIIVADSWKREVAELVEKGLSDREILSIVREKHGLKGREKDIVMIIQKYRRELDRNILLTSSINEYSILSEASRYIERKTGLKVEVMWESEAIERRIPRADKAYPLKPAFYIE